MAASLLLYNYYGNYPLEITLIGNAEVHKFRYKVASASGLLGH
jgi:hypothetical protein